MKVLDSGMPEEGYRESLFDIEEIIEWTGPERSDLPIVEVGCGYGTFTIPVALKARNLVYSFDIEESMIGVASRKADERGLKNILFERRDVIEDGTGLPANSVG
jgi:2-polyprenyl-3-methyl-5-hydroxy-6-metoxy-1,4-benzoquinol methylase